MTKPKRTLAGFSLIELSIVLVIITLLSGGLLLGLSASRESADRLETERRLEQARIALLGFASSQGRLPCPATADSSGNESPPGGGNCSAPWTGFLPAVTLGLQPVDEQGYALDPWGNPIRYAITAFTQPACGSAPCITTPDGIKILWNSDTPPAPDLRVCNTSQGSTGNAASAECASGHALTRDAAAIIFSRGKNGNRPPAGDDETANENADRLFVSHPPTLAPGAFDDQLSWLSASILYSRLIAAGRLP